MMKKILLMMSIAISLFSISSCSKSDEEIFLDKYYEVHPDGNYTSDSHWYKFTSRATSTIFDDKQTQYLEKEAYFKAKMIKNKQTLSSIFSDVEEYYSKIKSYTVGIGNTSSYISELFLKDNVCITKTNESENYFKSVITSESYTFSDHFPTIILNPISINNMHAVGFDYFMSVTDNVLTAYFEEINLPLSKQYHLVEAHFNDNMEIVKIFEERTRVIYYGDDPNNLIEKTMTSTSTIERIPVYYIPFPKETIEKDPINDVYLRLYLFQMW